MKFHTRTAAALVTLCVAGCEPHSDVEVDVDSRILDALQVSQWRILHSGTARLFLEVGDQAPVPILLPETEGPIHVALQMLSDQECRVCVLQPTGSWKRDFEIAKPSWTRASVTTATEEIRDLPSDLVRWEFEGGHVTRLVARVPSD